MPNVEIAYIGEQIIECLCLLFRQQAQKEDTACTELRIADLKARRERIYRQYPYLRPYTYND